MGSAGRTNEKPISLSPGDTAYIYRGTSPVRNSFRTNMCTGYLAEEGWFSPSLERRCPLSTEGEIPIRIANDDECFDYLQNFSRCEVPPNNFPEGLTGACRTYAHETLSYDTCVDTHINDKGFYRPEWRIYLNIRKQIWGERKESIQLLDQFGKVVDTTSYDTY